LRDSQVAVSGRSASVRSTTTPRMIAGSPSAMNSHCQPLSPNAPSSSSSIPEIGPPITEDSGTATRNQASIRVRYWVGNHAAK
jgi:hypothetical protein